MTATKNERPTRSRVLLFDLGGVLVDWAGIDAMVESARGQLDRETIRRYWLDSAIVRRFERGRIPAAAFASGVIGDLGLEVTTEALLAEFASWVRRPLPGALELLEELAPRYLLACLSNTNEVHARRIRDEFGFGGRLHRFYASNEIGHVKPERAAFEHVLRDVPCAPGEVLFFDDTAECIAGAEALGIPAELVRGPEGVREALARRGLFP